MEVFEIQISKQQILSLPDHERILVLQFGHVCNELSFLNKLLLIVSDTNTEGIERTAMVAQSMIVIRLYIGKLFEAWRMVERDYFKSQLSKSLDDKINIEGKDSLNQLKKYFGKSNALQKIRNNFSFHYLSEHINDVMASLDDSWSSSLILGDSHGNSLHPFAENIISIAMLKTTEKANHQEAMDTVVGDLVKIGGEMITFLGHALSTVLEERLGKSWEDLDHTKHNIKPTAVLSNYKLPFFFDVENETL